MPATTKSKTKKQNNSPAPAPAIYYSGGEKVKRFLRRLFNNWNKRRCPECGHKGTESITKEIINGIDAERTIVCSNCGHEVNYWAYGHYLCPVTKTDFIRYTWKSKGMHPLQRFWLIIQEAF